MHLNRLATGQYWHGQRAVELGLVQAIQTIDDFLLQDSEEMDLLRVKYPARKEAI